jgi:hypothetical protein
MVPDETAEKGNSWAASEARIALGLPAVVLLHQAIYAGNCAIIAMIEKGPNRPDYVNSVEAIRNTPSSIAWLLVYSIGAALLWWRARPAASIITLPFVLMACFWLFPYWLFPTFESRGSLREGVVDEWKIRAFSDFARGMFFACSALTVIGITRLKLGEGRQQTATLKRIVGIPVLEDQTSPALPQNTLLRASSPSEVPHEILLRPVKDTMETPPEELLRGATQD